MHVIVFFDYLDDVRDGTCKAVAPHGFLAADCRTGTQSDEDAALLHSGILDPHLEDTRILGIEESGRIDKGRFCDIRHPVWESVGVVYWLHITQCINDKSPALRRAYHIQHHLPYLSPSFPGENLRMQGNYLYFFRKIHFSGRIQILV